MMKKYPIVNGAASRLRSLCESAVRLKYNNDTLQAAEDYLAWELEAIERAGAPAVFLYLKDLTEKLGLKKHQYIVSWFYGGSMVTYLLDLSEIDPIQYNLPPEMEFGIHKDKPVELRLAVSEEYFQEATKYYETVDGVQAVVDLTVEGLDFPCRRMLLIPEGSEIPIVNTIQDEDSVRHEFYRQGIVSYVIFDVLSKLFEITGRTDSDITIYDKNVMGFFKHYDGTDEYYERVPKVRRMSSYEIQSAFEIETYRDLTRIQSLDVGKGVWWDNQERLVREGVADIRNVIAEREDIYDNCLMRGFDREFAYKVADDVARGRVLKGTSSIWNEAKPLLLNAGMPEWYVGACEKIEYLPHRWYPVSYMMLDWKLAWFKVHYPDMFMQVIDGYKF